MLSKIWVVMALTLVFAACKDKGGDDPVTVDNIVGTYTGDVKLMGLLPMGTTSVSMTKDDDTHVRLNVDLNAKFGEIVSIVLAEAFVHKVTRSDERYTLESNEQSVSVTVEVPVLGEKSLTRPVKVGGFVEGTKADLDITMPIPEDILNAIVEAIPDDAIKTAVKTALLFVKPDAAGDILVFVDFSGTK